MIYSIPPVGPGGLRPIQGFNHSQQAAFAASQPPLQTTRTEAGDRVDLSSVAIIVAKLSGSAPERMAKILAIKREINLGTYITEEKLHSALERMIESLSAKNLRR